MRLIRLLVLSVLMLGIGIKCSASATTDSLLNELNKVLANKDKYLQIKQNIIANLNRRLKNATSLNEKYSIYESLYDEYKSFSYDSSYTYAKKLELTSVVLKDPLLIASAKMKMSFTLLSSGLFKETLEELGSINLNALSVKDKADYYFLKGRTYFDLSDYDRSRDYSVVYDPKGIKCIDSAIALTVPGTFTYLELQGLKALRTGDYEDGRKTYIALLKLPGLTPHQFAVNACCLSYIYEIKGPQDKSVDLLIEAAISDVQSATKETVASYKLAGILYKKGDLDDAFVYIKQAMDDATYYGALHRQAQISSILPIIEAQWINQIEHQKKMLYISLLVITLMALFVVAFAVIIFIQLKKLRIADDLIKSANISLQENNKALEELNRSLSTANKIKNEYIGYYFNINTIYIEKLESFQKSLDKKLSSKRYEDAQNAVKNLNLENERQQLFHTFDKIFLRLFPDFIGRFNSLFSYDEHILIPEGQLLSTEHRIFALIRMGIHDNDRIAKLLGYSVNTIYAYKNRIKNKSFVPNDEFEDKIMEIEAV
jgi:tetratricopeptide (TPR) repeat protein